MRNAFRLAGFFAAHAICCVGDRKPLIPFFGYRLITGEYKMDPLEFNDLKKAIQKGRSRLKTKIVDIDEAVLLYVWKFQQDEELVDAVVIELRDISVPDSRASIAVPFTPPDSGGFLIHEAKLITWEQCEAYSISKCFQAFFEGVESHEKGGKKWIKYLDESK